MDSSFVFDVKREEPVLIPPSKPTPHEMKPLSDIDDQRGLRFQIPVIQIYRSLPWLRGSELTRVLRKALADALVFYYPLAGRLREQSDGKLIVDCTGEGLLFIEATADAELEKYGVDILKPPIPCLEELLYDVPGSGNITNSPLLLIQLTHFKCGGFIIALRFNHTLCDNDGLVQFMVAVAEMALGACEPSIPPVWQRELLDARVPPRITCSLPAYDHVPDANFTWTSPEALAHRSFFISNADIESLRKHLQPCLQAYTTFELLTACLWRCRTIAIAPEPDEEVRLVCTVNARSKYVPPLPTGYYGNVLAFTTAVSKAKELCRSERWLEYGLELIKKAKEEATQEYVQSTADLMVVRRRPPLSVARSWVVSDLRRGGSGNVDFGWGRPIYSGPAKGIVEPNLGIVSHYVPFKDGIVVPMSLPRPAMDAFSSEIQSLIKCPISLVPPL